MDALSLVLDASGVVTNIAVGSPEDVHAEDGCTVVLSDGAACIGWVRQPDGSFLDPRVPKPLTGADLVAYASDARWRLEVGGTTWRTLPVATDDRSKTLVQGELQAIGLGARQDNEYFKFADGIPRPLGNADIQSLALAMRDHVKRTFNAMFAVVAGIQAGTVTTTAQVDAALASAMAAA